MKDSFIKNFLVNLRAMFRTNLNKRINENTKKINSLEYTASQLDSQMTEKYHFLEVLGYFACHEEEAMFFSKELDYIRKTNRLDVFPYEIGLKQRGLVSGFDTDLSLPYVVHDGKKLFFASKYSESEAAEIYSYFIQTEKLLEVDVGEEAPHQYQSSNIHVEGGDVVFDIGAAEGLFALDQIDKASHVVIVENDPKWIEPLQQTFASFGDKVTIVKKMVSAVDTENTVSLQTLLSERGDCPAFVKMDIEGSELSVIASAKEVLKNSKGVKIAAASYHRQHDADELKALFDGIGLDSEFSKGYMLFHLYDTPVPPYFRHGIIRTKSLGL